MKLTVVFLNTFACEMNRMHLGECSAFQRRSVSIELTPEQERALSCRLVGEHNGRPQFETLERVWVEPDDEPPNPRGRIEGEQ